jgi:hypothetical protein
MSSTPENRPTHTAYSVHVYKKDGQHNSAHRAAWEHPDGEGFDMAFPVNARITLRRNRPQTEEAPRRGLTSPGAPAVALPLPPSITTFKELKGASL